MGSGEKKFSSVGGGLQTKFNFVGGGWKKISIPEVGGSKIMCCPPPQGYSSHAKCFVSSYILAVLSNLTWN